MKSIFKIIVYSSFFILSLTLSSCSTNPPARTISSGNKWPGRVVVNYDFRATSGLSVDTLTVHQMLDSSVKKLTGKLLTNEAWKSVFPSTLTENSKIAIKTNLINPGNSTPHYYLILSLIHSLSSIRFGDTSTIHQENITVYDGNNRHAFSEAFYQNDLFAPTRLIKDSMIQWGDGANGFSYATTVQKCDFLINVFSLSGHNQNYGGFFLGFKNHYGSYDPSFASQNQQGLVSMNCTGPVFNKTVLSICCGLYGIDEGKGPFGGVSDFSTYVKSIDPNSKGKNPNTLIMSTDPVSCEVQAIKILRVNKNRSYVPDSLPDYLQASAGICRPDLSIFNIGIIDEKLMDIRRIISVAH